MLVSRKIPVEVKDGVGLNGVINRVGVVVGVPGLILKLGEGEGELVEVTSGVGGERSNHPGEGEVLSRQSTP